MKTSVGDIDIELWSKETPKACRNFIQLCMEGYYDETIFHRIVKGFTSFFVFNFSNLFFTNLSMIYISIKLKKNIKKTKNIILCGKL